MSARSGFRFWAGIAALAVLAAIEIAWLAAHATWGTFTAIVQEGSMAPTLLGPHWAITCPRCRLAMEIDAVNRFGAGATSCPNCGHAAISLEDLPAEPGDTVQVVRFDGDQTPNRWDIVVCRLPGEEGQEQLAIKRVVGLPTETLELRGGDVWIDGDIAARPLDVLRQMTIVVADGRHFLPAEPILMWWGQSRGDDFLMDAAPPASEPAWHFRDGIWTTTGHSPSRPNGDRTPAAETAWLSFHYRAYEPHHPPDHRARLLRHQRPLLDDTPYNVGESRRLNRVTDCGLRCLAKAGPGVRLALAYRSQPHPWFVELDCDGENGVLRDGDREVARFEAKELPWRTGVEIEWYFADGALRLALAGRTVLGFRPSEQPVELPDAPALAIGVARGGPLLILERLQAVRDVYYLASAVGAASSPGRWQLEADEYFLLGDNSPVSIDSRNWWPGKKVRRADLLGKLLPPGPRRN